MTEKGDLPVKIAGKDIRCMKVLEQRKDGYITPYRYKHVPDETISGEEDFTADRSAPGDYGLETRFSVSGRAHVEIGGGAVHTYAYTKDSDKAIRSEVLFLRRQYCPQATVVFECVIPKGTEYMAGTYDGKKCYGSKSIRFVRELLRFDRSPEGPSDPVDRGIIYDKVEENADLFRET